MSTIANSTEHHYCLDQKHGGKTGWFPGWLQGTGMPREASTGDIAGRDGKPKELCPPPGGRGLTKRERWDRSTHANQNRSRRGSS